MCQDFILLCWIGCFTLELYLWNCIFEKTTENIQAHHSRSLLKIFIDSTKNARRYLMRKGKWIECWFPCHFLRIYQVSECTHFPIVSANLAQLLWMRVLVGFVSILLKRCVYDQLLTLCCLTFTAAVSVPRYVPPWGRCWFLDIKALLWTCCCAEDLPGNLNSHLMWSLLFDLF